MLSSLRPIFDQSPSPFMQFYSMPTTLRKLREMSAQAHTFKQPTFVKQPPIKLAQRQQKAHNTIQISQSSNMKQQLNWFISNSKTKILTRLIAVILLFIGLYVYGFMELEFATCLVVYIGFELGLRKCNYVFEPDYLVGKGVRKWAQCSKITTIWVLAYQILIGINKQVAVVTGISYNQSYFPFLVSLHATVLFLLFQLNSKMLMLPVLDNWREKLYDLPASLRATAVRIWTLKLAILQIFILMSAATVILSIVLQTFSQGVQRILSLLAVGMILATVSSLILIELVCQTFLFNPVLFSDLPLNRCPRNRMNTPMLVQLLKVRAHTHNISNELAEIIHYECLKWIVVACADHPHFLANNITGSQFYHHYSDIMTEFSLYRLRDFYDQLSNALIQTKQLTYFQLNSKPMHQDLFFFLRVIYKKMRVQASVTRVLTSLETITTILEIVAIEVQFEQNDEQQSSDILQELFRIATAAKELMAQQSSSNCIRQMAKSLHIQIQRTLQTALH